MNPVEAPFPIEAPYRVVPAPRPLGDAAHIVLDDAWPAAATRRLERLRTDPDGVLVFDGPVRPGLAEALRRAWSLLPVPRSGDTVAVPHLGVEVDLVRLRSRRTAACDLPAAQDAVLARHGLDLLVVGWLLACSEDLVVLRRTGPSAVVAELLAVAFPSGWPPRERAGASLAELHRPVADGARLQRATPALSAALLTKGPYLQHVWGLDPSGRLDRDPSAPDAAYDGEVPASQWWLRVERQTTLPLGDRALFVIRPFLVPLVALDGRQRSALAAAVASMSPASLAYKGITGVRDELLGWLQLSEGSSG